MLLYPPDSKEEERQENTDERADGDFFGLMADSLLESREAVFIELELLRERVEEMRVFAHVDAEAERVEDDNTGECDRNGEAGCRESVKESNRCNERRDEGSVRTRHVPVGD